MQNIFSNKVDLTPLKILFSILAISLVGIFSDVSAMTSDSNWGRPVIMNLKNELKACPIPYLEDKCERKGKQVNFCQDGSSNILKTWNLAPLFDGMKSSCSFSSQPIENRNES